ncbi:MAG: two-component system sensor histidine kinase CreC [Burkholderiaceae bacterium]
MSKRNRIFIGILLIYAAGTAFLLYRVVADLDPRYRESAEESLVETSQLLASWVEQEVQGGVIDTTRLAPVFQSAYARTFEARIFSLSKTRIELRVRVTDSAGRVLYDSLGQQSGADFSDWRDVKLALRGEYGARTTPDVAGDNGTAVMYVAAPVRHGNAIIGAVSVGKPVQSFGQFVQSARQKTLYVGLLSVAAILLLAVTVSVWLVLPSGVLSDYWRYARTQRRLSLPRLGRRALAVASAAYNEMRDTLAGRNYVADYVQTLTHEVKSPLSAIRGAAELLQEANMPAAERALFLANITRETGRIQEMVDRMMELTVLETRRALDILEPVALLPLLHELAHAAQASAASRRIGIEVSGVAASTEGDAFLLRRAISNLLDNAVDFSSEGGTVTLMLSVNARHAVLRVQDQGPGIPDYAQDKVFEKFYSLARPHTRKKSTGLGLAFVKEIAGLHHGRITLANAEQGGTVATLTLPLLPS